MKLWQSPTRHVRPAALLCAAVAVLVFANSLGNDFAYDDRPIIVDNSRIHDLAELPTTLTQPYWPNTYGKELGLWRPVTTGVFGLQWALWGGAPVGFHLVNVLLNAAAAALVVVLLSHLMPLGVALLGGLVFAVHPVHTEAVANVVGMAELLSTVLYLCACILVIRSPGSMGWGRLVSVCLLFGLACLTKESAITLPGAVVLLDGCRRDVRVRDFRRYLRRRGPLLAGLTMVAIGVVAGRMAVLGSVASPFAPLGAEILAEDGVARIWTVLATWPEIFRLLFFPMDLSSDYTPEVVSVHFGWGPQNILGLVLGLSALVMAFMSWRTGRLSARTLSARLVGFGVVWFVITAAPTSNLVFLSGVLLAERTLYLPSVGFVAGLAWLLASFHKTRPRAATFLAVLCLALMSYRTVTRNPTWKDNLTVFSTMLAEHPESGRAQWVAGDLHYQRGRDAEGMAAYRRAIGMVGGHYTLVVEVGRSLVSHGEERVGEFLLRHAWRDRPEFPLAPSLLTPLYDRQERWAEAEHAARSALAVDSTNAVQAHLLSKALEAQGRLDEAVVARRRAIALGEDRWEQWAWLSELELQRGDTLQAVLNLDTARTRVRNPGDLAAVDSTRLALLPLVVQP